MSTDKIDYEVAPDIEELAKKICQRIRALHWLLEDNVFDTIAFVRAYVEKKTGKGATFADIRKVPGPYKAFIPYDLLFTIYEPLVSLFSQNQLKILIYHELLHISANKDGISLREHDVKDFYVILKNYGVDWTSYDNERVPDILEEKGVIDDD